MDTVRAVNLSTGPFCTEFRCEQLCDDGIFWDRGQLFTFCGIDGSQSTSIGYRAQVGIQNHRGFQRPIGYGIGLANTGIPDRSQ